MNNMARAKIYIKLYEQLGFHQLQYVPKSYLYKKISCFTIITIQNVKVSDVILILAIFI